MSDRVNHAAQPSIEPARGAAFAALAQDAISGSLTLDDYADRAAAAQQASSTDELDLALLGLPDEAAALPPAKRRWLIAVVGGAELRGRWRLGHLWIVAVLGGAKVDLGTAQLEAREPVITLIAVFGGAEIFAPPGVPIQLSGFSLLGGKGDKRSAGPSLPGSPLVRVRGFSIFGGVTIKDRPERRNLLDTIRGPKRQANG
jgi:hypothetical protein